MNVELMRTLFSPEALFALSPMIALAAGVVLLLLAGLVPLGPVKRAAIVVATLAAAGTFQALLLAADPAPGLVLDGTLIADRASAAWGLLFLAATALAWLFGQHYYDEDRPFKNEHDLLLLVTPIGMMMMAGAQDLIVFFVGLELLSIPLYTLAAFRRNRARSVEAGLKYFLLGSFSTAFFLYGAALLYTSTGTLSLVELATRGLGDASPRLARRGVALLAASLFFKISVFPFHLWVPDVYQGAPTPVTVLMATGTKAAAFAFLLRATFLLPSSAANLIAVVALATMALGNLGALAQEDLKRMLAYSGIAHAGTVLLVVAGALAGDPEPDGALHAALFYLAAYVFTAAGAFGLVALLERGGERFTKIDSLRGLWHSRPLVAAAMTLFMLSLGGIPITGGFLGKYLVFDVAVRAHLVAVAVIGVLLSVIALGYYLRVIVAMYMQPSDDLVPAAPTPERSGAPAAFAACVCAALVVAMGVLPGWFLSRL